MSDAYGSDLDHRTGSSAEEQRSLDNPGCSWVSNIREFCFFATQVKSRRVAHHLPLTAIIPR